MDKLVYAKSNVFELHKRTLGKTYQRKNADQRAHQFKDLRRQTRHGLLLAKRNIDLENDSPFVTPETDKPNVIKTKYVSNQKKAKDVTNRNERLLKWKAEKERRKLEEKKNAKPAFKLFCKVPVELGLPNLDNINKEIKGKPIKPIYKSVFAPKNHIFQPPRNVKTVDVKTVAPGNKENQSSRKTTRIPVNHARTNKNKSQTRLLSKCVQGHTPKELTIHKNVWTFKPVKLTGSSTPADKLSQRSYDRKENISNTNGFSGIELEDSKGSSMRLTKSGKRKKVHIEEEPIVIEDSVIEMNSTDIDLTKTPGSDRETIYSDDEISIRTPIRKSHLHGFKKSTPHSKILNISLDSESEDLSSPVERRSLRVSLKPLRYSKGNQESGEEKRKLYVTQDTIRNNSMNTKSVSFVPEQAENLSPKIMLAKDDALVASVKKNKRGSMKARGSTAASKRLSSTVYRAAEASHHPTERLDEKIEDIANDKLSTKKSVTFVTASANNLSPNNSHLEDKPVNASVKKNKRRSRSIIASKRFSLSTSSSDEAANYFTKILDDEISRIEGICDIWDNYKTETDLTEDVENMINAAIGLSKLLIAKKFPQFRELIEECRLSIFKEKPITSQDLQGYWETTYIQVEDLDKKFAHLERLKMNHWQEVVSEKKKVLKKVKSKPKKAVASKLKDIIKAARNKKKEEGLDGSFTRFGMAASTPRRLSKGASAKKKRASVLVTPGRNSSSRSSMVRTPRPVV